MKKIRNICICFLTVLSIVTDSLGYTYAAEIDAVESNDFELDIIENDYEGNDLVETLDDSQQDSTHFEDDSTYDDSNDNSEDTDEYSYKQYECDVIYNKGDIVYNDGTYWVCNWYTCNNEPLRGKHDGCWYEYVPESDEGISDWSPDKIYQRGQLVRYKDELWQCLWWSDYAEPGTTGEYGCWRVYENECNCNNIDSEKYIDQIGLYYEYINNDEREKVSQLFVDELKIEYDEFFSNELTKINNTGIWNINDAKVDIIKEIPVAEDPIEEGCYQDVKSFFVKTYLDCKNNDEYSWNGVIYYIFTIGMENGSPKIISKRMPIADIYSVTENDNNIEDINDYYQNVTDGNCMVNLLESKALSTVDSTATIDPDRSVSYGSNWSSLIPKNINIYLKPDSTPGAVTATEIKNAKKRNKNGQPIITKNFNYYCKVVVNSEYGTAGMSQSAYNAVAMCVKNFAINCYKLNADLAYDITNVHTGGMSYLPNKKTFLSNCEKAVDDTWDRVMLTDGYGLFRAYFKSDAKASPYCVYHGGQLNLSEIDALARKGKLRNDILHYYFDYGTYNKYTARGPIRIVSTKCAHKYSSSSPKKCITCGCSKK